MMRLRPSSHPAARLREAVDADDAELLKLFAASRVDLLAAISQLDESQRESFMRIQFEARRNQYRRQYPQAHWEVIVTGDKIIGQIVVALVGDEFRLVDLALLPAFRNRGIGSAVLQDLLDEAAGAGRSVSLHVLRDNPALHLYRRLGFVVTGEDDVYRHMQWAPVQRAASANGVRHSTGVS